MQSAQSVRLYGLALCLPRALPAGCSLKRYRTFHSFWQRSFLSLQDCTTILDDRFIKQNSGVRSQNNASGTLREQN
ncbi:hypothetical protein [Nostoc sp.]|uniref:hypothetical protein n=1 Tax=Nostoc sp. TaxID=1180 RepID=UPI002FFBFC68